MRRWLGRELNPRHEDFQSSALPTELPSHLSMTTAALSPTNDSRIYGMLTFSRDPSLAVRRYRHSSTHPLLFGPASFRARPPIFQDESRTRCGKTSANHVARNGRTGCGWAVACGAGDDYGGSHGTSETREEHQRRGRFLRLDHLERIRRCNQGGQRCTKLESLSGLSQARFV